MDNIYIPLILVLLVYLFFLKRLYRIAGKNLFCDLGFVSMSLLEIYTIAPGIAIAYGLVNPDYDTSALFGLLSNNKSELILNFWRHLLFIFCFAVGYISYRGKENITLYENINKSFHYTIVALISIIILNSLFLSILSAPVNDYYDNYTRYNHLPVLLQISASVFIRFKAGFYIILITLMFFDYKRYKNLISISIILICTYELIYSHGARIYIFITLLQSFFLYNYFVEIVSLRRIVFFILILVLLFSAIEVLRLNNLNLKDAKEQYSEGKVSITPGELSALYLPSFHLYSERYSGQLPKREWQMFFYDFISPFTLNSSTRWNIMYWYARNYFPESEFPPLTIGPIAESAVWGGEIDLFFRGLVNGLFFAYIVRWFLKRKQKWWAVVVYAFCFSYSVITLKYSVFFYFTPLVKNIIPTLIFVAFMSKLFMIKKSENNLV